MAHLLIVAHSCSDGGAERGLKHFIDSVLALAHRVTILLPAAEGPFVDWVRAKGLTGLTLPMQQTCPRTTLAFLQVSMQGLEAVAGGLRPLGFDAVVTNTAVILHGARLADFLGLPHLCYVHELIDDESELRTTGLPSEAYLRLIARQSDHLLCCSEAVAARFRLLGVATPTSVLFPHVIEPIAALPPAAAPVGAFQLFAIGVQSIRKNPVFAVTVLQALHLRGHAIHLHLIGGENTQTPRLQAAIRQRGLVAAITVHGQTGDPYALVQGRAVNLVGAASEAFGLTIPESLARGIPVVASRSGGPETLLPASQLFDVNDVDGAVRRIEAVLLRHAMASAEARALYDALAPCFSPKHRSAVIAEALYQAKTMRRDKAAEPFFGPVFRDAICLTRMPASRLRENIAMVCGLSGQEIDRRIEHDRRHPGAAVMADCQRYDVVPFTATGYTDQLYREGFGFVIELASTYDDQGRLGMAAFILTRLLHESQGRKLRVLALGDGIGVDTLRLLDGGLDVDYIDYDMSVTARVARRNLDSYFDAPSPHAGRVRVIGDVMQEAPYDAVMCLEVIEHVGDPVGFLRMLSERLAPAGLLFISECFDGVRNHWPTHLQSNEDFSGLLPLMGREMGLALDDVSVSPYGKPYVMRKRTADEVGRNLAAQLRADKGLLRHVLGAQLQLGA